MWALLQSYLALVHNRKLLLRIIYLIIFCLVHACLRINPTVDSHIVSIVPKFINTQFMKPSVTRDQAAAQKFSLRFFLLEIMRVILTKNL